MADVFWSRVGLSLPAVVIGTFLMTMALPGCGKGGGDEKSGAPPGADPSGGNGNIVSIEKAANDRSVMFSPFDATLDPEARTVYFVARASDGLPGIFQVPASGGAISPVFVGDPLVSPFGIAITADGRDLYVSDPGANVAGKDRGAIFRIGVEGGTPQPVSGTETTIPKSVEITGSDLYFTGIISKEGGVVLKVPLTGGSPSKLAAGLMDPSGIAVSESGTVYVVDSIGAESRQATVLRISGDFVDVLASDIPVGFPAGIALSKDESVLLVSGLHKGLDAVYRVDIANKTITLSSAGIDKFHESAGLHRAKNKEVYAWADSLANKSGTVYVLTAK
jgi:DNA-binding beta-propeller fold protein YncE